MKRKKNIKPINTNYKHNIPLNLYDPILQSIPQSFIPPSAISGCQTNQITPNCILNPLAVYWQLVTLQNPGLLPHPQVSPFGTENLAQLDKAAVTIQKNYRGYLVRKRFVSWTFNPITKLTKPDVYQTESLIYTVIQEMIIDIAVEVCQDQYHPISRELKSETMLYHTLQQMIHQAASSAINELKLAKAGFAVPSVLDSLIPENAFLIELLNDYTKEIFFEAVHERVLDYTLEEESNYGLDYLVNELIADEMMLILFDIYVEDIYDDLMAEEIREFVYRDGLPICKSSKVKLVMNRPSKPKSLVIDAKMDFILDKMICEELLLSIIGPPLEDKFDLEIDMAIAQELILRL